MVARQVLNCLNHFPSPFCDFFFFSEIGSFQLFPTLASNGDPLDLYLLSG
jgi:hypothetical protein